MEKPQSQEEKQIGIWKEFETSDAYSYNKH